MTEEEIARLDLKNKERELFKIAEKAVEEDDADTEETIREVERMILELRNPKPERSFFEQAGENFKVAGENLSGIAEAATTVGTGMVGGLGGGLTYAASAPVVGHDAAKATMEGVQNELTYQPRSESGQEKVQSVMDFVQPIEEGIESYSQGLGDDALAGNPRGINKMLGVDREPSGALGATVEYMMPRILSEAVGYLLTGGLANRAKYRSNKLNKSAKKEEIELNRETEFDAEQIQLEEAVELLKKADQTTIAQMIDADPRLLHVIEELGIESPALASYYSQNPQYQSIEMGLASLDGSALNLQHKAFIQEASKKADEIIESYGGNTEKLTFSDDMHIQFDEIIEQLKQSEEIGYKAVNDGLPPLTRTDAANTLAYLEDLKTKLGGQLTGSFKTLYDDLQPKQKRVGKKEPWSNNRERTVYQTETEFPTFAFLEEQRQLAGKRVHQQGGKTFADKDSRQLDMLYSAMKRDQEAVYAKASQDNPKLKSLAEIANRNTIQRKTIEEQYVYLAGKELDKNLVNRIGTGIKRLAKGEADTFDKIMTSIESLPKDMREGAVLSAMNHAWSGTAASKQAFGEAQFAKFWTAIEREPRIKKRLMDNLPEASRSSVENLGKLSQMLYKSNQNLITTGRLAELFKDSGGTLAMLSSRLMGQRYVKMATELEVKGSSFAKLIEAHSDKAMRANEMLADGRFKKIIVEAHKEGVHLGNPVSPRMKRISEDYMKSKNAKFWAETLEPTELQRLTTVGLVNYLINPRMEQLNNITEGTE